MRLLTLDHLPDTPPDAQCAPSTRAALLIAVIAAFLGAAAFALATGAIPRGPLPAAPFWLFAPFFLLAGAFAAFGWRSMRRSKPWLCRRSGDTLWVRCSNRPDALILELHPSDLAWVQPVKLTSVWKYARGGADHQFFPYLDLGLTAAAVALLDAFARDDAVAPATRAQLSLAPETLTQPVRLIRPGVLRLYWSGISPALSTAAKLLAPRAELRPLHHEKVTND